MICPVCVGLKTKLNDNSASGVEDRPRLLDLFCGAGGSSVGYSRAGFAPYGIDNNPKPLRHYPFPHICMDALEAVDRLLAGEGLTFSNGETLYLADFAAFHASPPCQYYSRLRYLPRLKGRQFWRSVPPTRERLEKLTVPWVMENVEDCWDMPDAFVACGYSIGMALYRHRRIETTFPIMWYPHQRHKAVIVSGRASLGKRHHGQQGFKEIKRRLGHWWSVTGHSSHVGDTERRKAVMGIDWMTGDELAQAMPPVYTEYIGGYLMKAHIRGCGIVGRPKGTKEAKCLVEG